VLVVGVQHESPLPAVGCGWKASVTVNRLAILDALDRDHAAECGGRAGGRAAGVPWLLGTVVAVGIRGSAIIGAKSNVY